MLDRVLTFGLLFGAWVVLSGQLDAFHLVAGVLCAGMVTVFSGRRLWFRGRSATLVGRLLQGWRFAGFLLWLVWQIVVANCYIIYLSLHPRSASMLSPRMVRFRTKLRGDFARFALANSITLTPGTITVEVIDDLFVVHAINERTAAGVPGSMEQRLAEIFEPEVLAEFATGGSVG